MIDIIEQEIAKMSRELFDVLLKDRTTQKNICWATDYYKSNGPSYYPQEPITQNLVTGENTKLVQPRVSRAINDQARRTKEKAEVFTPSWVCNEQNNLIDTAWFGQENVFNTTDGHSWITVQGAIEFPDGKSWEKYVDARRLEISCGEAPYLVSRYDTISGDEIPIDNRIGLLDRKLRIISEHTITEEDWYRWVVRAYESTYGYEYQGDNILIARENLLFTFIENMEYRFSHEPNDKQLKQIAKIISWNIWQMDGISMTAPFSERPRVNAQMTISDYLNGTQDNDKEPIPCKVFDWRSKYSFEFRAMVKGDNDNEIR
jgi:hypothetical protein